MNWNEIKHAKENHYDSWRSQEVKGVILLE